MDDNKRAGWNPLKGTLLLLFVLGLCGIAFFFWKYDDVFPAAAVDLKLSKTEIAGHAQEYCALVGYKPAGCIESTTFQERSEIATFLEHEFSMREANALMHSEINVFYWYTRFCRPHQEEECQVWLGTDGHLAGINRDIEKERPMPSISQADAMAMALKFVKDNAGVALYDELPPGQPAKLANGIKLIKQGTVKQSNRTDHYFTWEDENHDYKGGHIRTTVDISGNQVTSFDRELHIPESYERRFADIRSYNDLLKAISSILFAIVGTGMGVAFIWALSTRRLRGRLVLISAVISFCVEMLDFWNNWPAILQAYKTTESFQGFLGHELVSSVMTAVSASLAAMTLVGGIEAVYRHTFPKKIAGEHILNFKNLSNHRMLEIIIAGICVFGVHLGYVAVYYLVGTKMGMWSPLEVRDVTTMSSLVPAFSSFAVGVNASASEELLYRVLCFVIAQKLFKNFWIANFVQAAGWAFMHSDYPQEPAYARGIELTIVGLFYGYMLRRFGVLTGIISHFIYDAFLGITPMLLSQSISMQATGLLACVPPFLALGIGLLRRSINGEEVSDEALLNENLVPPSPPHPAPDLHEERHLVYKQFFRPARVALLLVCAASLAICVLGQVDKIGNWARVTATKAQIEEVARSFLRERGVKEGDWKVSSLLYENLDNEEIQYGFEKVGYKRTEKIMHAARIPLLWWVRFYKPHQRREYDVGVSSEGRPVAMQVTEEEDAGGKSITEEDAHRLTEEFLKTYRPEFLPLEFETVVEQKRKNRTDYLVSYVVPDFKIGDARLKINVDTVGGLVSFPQVAWDIPDSWKFERSKSTMKDEIAKIASLVTMGILSIFVGIWAWGVFRAQAVHWRPVLFSSTGFAILSLITQLNEFNYKLTGYDTDVPFFNFLTGLAVKAIISAIFYGAMFGVLVAVGHGAFRILFPGVTLQSLWHCCLKPPPERRSETRAFWADGALAAYTWVLGFNALAIGSVFCASRFSPEVQVQSLSHMVDATHYTSPALDQITSSFIAGFAALCMAPVAVGLYLKYCRSFMRYLLFSMLILLIVESTTKHWQDYVIEVITSGAYLVALYCWVKYCARNNPVAYFLVGALNSLVLAFYYIFRFSSNVYSTDLCIMAVFLCLPPLVPFVFKRASGNGRAPGGTGANEGFVAEADGA